jgi:hypothetical protein
MDCVEPRGGHPCVRRELDWLARRTEEAGPRVAPGKKGDPECSTHERQQRRAGSRARGPGRDEECAAQDQTQRPHEQQPEPERFDRHGGRSVRAELEADLLL